MKNNSWYSIKWKPRNTMKNAFIQVRAKDKREAKRLILKKLNTINSKYLDVYRLEEKNNETYR